VLVFTVMQCFVFIGRLLSIIVV